MLVRLGLGTNTSNFIVCAFFNLHMTNSSFFGFRKSDVIKNTDLCWQGKARKGIVGLARQIGQALSSSAELEDFSLENGRRKFLTEEELRRGRSNSNISCHEHKKVDSWGQTFLTMNNNVVFSLALGKENWNPYSNIHASMSIVDDTDSLKANWKPYMNDLKLVVHFNSI